MKKTFLYILIAGIGILSVSCEKLLETKPREAVNLDDATKSKDAFISTLVSIYNNMRVSSYYGRDFILQSELLGDNADVAATNSNRLVGESRNTRGSHFVLWTTCYQNIFRCNYIFKFIDGVPGISFSESEQIKGESYFLRALNHFDLVRAYARPPLYMHDFELGVPIVLEANIDANDPSFPGFPERAKVADVYAQIVKDLDSAANKLSRAESGAGVVGPFRASSLAAIALKSRVLLYQGDWAGAEAAATAALGKLPFNTPSVRINFVTDSATYVSKWGNLHPEIIFGTRFETYEALGTNSIQYLAYVSPVHNGYGDVIARTELLNAYYPQDIRRNPLLIAGTKGGQAVNWTQKWPGARAYRGGDDIMYIRVSELYLNRAEARARINGKDPNALADLNVIHTRAMLPALANLEDNDLIQAILRERRIELAFEGHRLFDLLRTGQQIIKGVTTIDNNDFKLVAPLPLAELDVNKKLVQNPLY